MKNTRKKKLSALIIALCLIAILVFLFWPIIDKQISNRKFNSNDWKDPVKTMDGERVKMIDHLLKQYSLIGKTKSEIETLLGVPPQTNYFKNYDYIYWIGPEDGFISIDSKWLALKFENEKVIAAKILTD